MRISDWISDVCSSDLAFLRFDYAGCGRSEGAFADQTLAGWRDDALTMIDWAVTGPVVLVGSSMGGWIMLLAALARPDRVAGLVGIAAAPDFTDWGFRSEEHTSELQSLMRISYAVFCLKKKTH